MARHAEAQGLLVVGSDEGPAGEDDEEQGLLVDKGSAEPEAEACLRCPSVTRSTCRLGVAVLVWYSAHSYSVVVSGALIRDHLHLHPLVHVTVTATQVLAGVFMSAVYCCAAALGRCSLSSACGESDDRERMTLMSAALVFGAGICQLVGTAGTNASMASSGATLTQVFKSSEPAFTAALKWAVLGKPSVRLEVLALLVIVVGTMVTSTSKPAGKHGGGLSFSRALLPTLFACVSLPLMRVLTKSAAFPKMSSGAHTLLVLGLVGLLPAIAVLFLVFRLEGVPPRDRRFVWSAISFNAYQLASLSVLREVDAISHSIGNALKRVFVITISLVAFREQLGAQSATGIVIVFLGIVLHAEQAQPHWSTGRFLRRSAFAAGSIPLALALVCMSQGATDLTAAPG
ncbi:hypothetical protein T492DRAFT_1047068 [Pavlovales sp. CCMP2436]|nr:hypothetical protein T492DRAFT_1047068 [Pavlovales sp. CCMP2436]